MSKKIYALIIAVFLLGFAVVLSSCDTANTPEIVYPINQAIDSPEQFMYKSAAFVDGIVVYKAQKDGNHMVAVVGKPFPKVKDVKDLGDHQVMIIKLGVDKYNVLEIGSVVSIRGQVKKAEKDSKSVYYVDTYEVFITGKEAIDDPDFERLVEVVSHKIKSDKDWEFFWLMWFLIFMS
jgi:hypothetical protein